MGEAGYLVMTLGEFEDAHIGRAIEITPVEIGGSRARLAFRAPKEIEISRTRLEPDGRLAIYVERIKNGPPRPPGSSGLVLTLKEFEDVYLSGGIEVALVGLGKSRVKIAIRAPEGLRISRADSRGEGEIDIELVEVSTQDRAGEESA